MQDREGPRFALDSRLGRVASDKQTDTGPSEPRRDTPSFLAGVGQPFQAASFRWRRIGDHERPLTGDAGVATMLVTGIGEYRRRGRERQDVALE
jgi:hypothetical protein